MKTDFTVEPAGLSLVLLRPITKVAKDWIGENIPDDAQSFGGAIAVEPRYIENIIQGIEADGLKVN